MTETEKTVRNFMGETMPFTYKTDDNGLRMTILANFYDWLKQNEELAISRVSYQREQLKAQKLKDLKNWLKSDVKNIDSGIIKQKETELTRFKRKVLDKVKEIERL